MGKLSELVDRDYKEELEIIKAAGTPLWPMGVGFALFLAFLCVLNFFFAKPWDRRDFELALAIIVVGPFINRVWERHKVAAQMRHERQVRVEAKLDALLGLVNIKDDHRVG
jgi:hypothetical protein